MPDSLLADSALLASVARTHYTGTDWVGEEVSGLQLACSTLFVRVVRSFLAAIPPKADTIHIKTSMRESVLVFLLKRRGSWRDAIGPVLRALVEHGFKLDDSDLSLLVYEYTPQYHPAIKYVLQYSQNMTCVLEMLDEVLRWDPREAAEYLFASCHILLRRAVYIWYRGPPVAHLLHISPEQ